MRNVRFVLVAFAALVIAMPLAAQERPKRQPNRMSPMVQAMMRLIKMGETIEKLDLTADQKEKLKELRAETGPKMKAIFEKLEEIVPEQQRTAAKEAAKAAKEAGKEGRAVFMAGQRAAKLTDEQQAEVDKLAPEVLAAQREIMKRVMAMLTPEQKKKLKELRPTAKKKVKQVRPAGKKKSE